MEQNSDLVVALDIVKRTNQEKANKWRTRANEGRKSQRVEVGQLVWVKRDCTASQTDCKLGVKWLGLFKVKEVY